MSNNNQDQKTIAEIAEEFKNAVTFKSDNGNYSGSVDPVLTQRILADNGVTTEDFARVNATMAQVNDYFKAGANLAVSELVKKDPDYQSCQINWDVTDRFNLVAGHSNTNDPDVNPGVLCDANNLYYGRLEEVDKFIDSLSAAAE